MYIFAAAQVAAQDFKKDMATAKEAYSAGKLEDTHFALQQAMQEIDLIVGKEVLLLLPQKMDTLLSNPKQDKVASTVGFVGASIQRVYGINNRKADLSIISNSPMVAMMNNLLNMPMIGGGMSDGRSKNVKVQGYKARLERQDGSSDGKMNYELQIPLGNALITFKLNECSDSEILTLANTIPMAQIAKLIQ